MKRNILIYLFLGLWITPILGQTNNWPAPEAVFVYKKLGVVVQPKDDVFHTLTLIKDTIVNNITASQLELRRIIIYKDPSGVPLDTTDEFLRYEYLYEDQDDVFWLREGQFVLLFKFNASIGDQWEILKDPLLYHACDSTSILDTIKVISESTLQFYGNSYDITWMESQGGLWFQSHILDGIGPMAHPFPYPIDSDSCVIPGSNINIWGTLECYYDTIRGFTELGQSGNDCTSIVSKTKRDRGKITPNSVIKYYPNPVTDLLYLELDRNKNYTIMIYDIAGRLIKQIPSFNNKTINCSDLQRGFYIVSLISENEVISFKMLKN